MSTSTLRSSSDFDPMIPVLLSHEDLDVHGLCSEIDKLAKEERINHRYIIYDDPMGRYSEAVSSRVFMLELTHWAYGDNPIKLTPYGQKICRVVLRKQYQEAEPETKSKIERVCHRLHLDLNAILSEETRNS